LLDLKIFFCNVLSAATIDGQPRLNVDCTKLTHLQMLYDMRGAPEGVVVDSLSSLVHLRHLEFMPALMRHQFGGLSVVTLSQLQQLTFLKFHSLSVENLLQLGGLSSLQVLHLSAAGDVAVGPSSVPGLVFPASLKALTLSSPVQAGILSVVPTGLRTLRVGRDVEGPAEGPDSFLSCMARLQHLTLLSVQAHGGLDCPPAGPAYSALTASSNLVHLHLFGTDWPEGIWPHVFPSQRRLHHLAELHLHEYINFDGPAPPLPWDARDLISLVNCCPSLHSLPPLPLQHGVHVSELHKLTGVTWLRIKFAEGNLPAVDQSLKGLASLTHLHCLDVHLDGHVLEVSSLLPLTVLTNLEELTLSCEAVDGVLDGDSYAGDIPGLAFYNSSQVSQLLCHTVLCSSFRQCMHHAGSSLHPCNTMHACLPVACCALSAACKPRTQVRGLHAGLPYSGAI
jgi:hypothetical protein